MKLLIISILISSACFGQAKKDSSNKTAPVKIDSTTIVISELAQFAYDKVSAKDYDVMIKIMQEFLKAKEFRKP